MIQILCSQTPILQVDNSLRPTSIFSNHIQPTALQYQRSCDLCFYILEGVLFTPEVYPVRSVSAYVPSSFQCSPDSYSCSLVELAKLSRPAAITAVGPSWGDLPIRGVGGGLQYFSLHPAAATLCSCHQSSILTAVN